MEGFEIVAFRLYFFKTDQIAKVALPILIALGGQRAI